MLSRRAWLQAAAGGTALALMGRARWGGPLSAQPEVVVYKSPSCGCCTRWVTHLRDSGFRVSTHDVDDLAPVKREHQVPDDLASCHTGVVEGYVIEGHVPADLVGRLLRERPEAAGLAVPGMPMGSPGMEGPHREAYDVLLFLRDGSTRVYASR